MAALAHLLPQEALVENAVKSMPLPEGVRLRRILVDTDQSGDPAIYIVFGVSKKVALTGGRVRMLGALRRAVTDAVDELNTGRLPYIRFEDAR